MPALTATPADAANCSPPGRFALEVRGGGSVVSLPETDTEEAQTLGSGVVGLGLRYSLRPEKLIVVHPFIGAHLLYLPSGGDRSAHLAAAMAEFGVRFQQLRVPLGGFYIDVRAGGFAGVNIPKATELPPGVLAPEPTPEIGGTAAVGFGYRTERVEIGLEFRDMLATSGANNVLIIGMGGIVF